MSSSVPLINAVAQNTVDFNNQTPSNAGGLFRYKIKSIGYPSEGVYYLQPEDLNSVLIFSGNVTLYLDSNSFSASGLPPVGSEVFFYSINGAPPNRVYVETSGFNLYYYVGPYLQSSNDNGKIIYTGENAWTFASLNYNFQPISSIDCCSANNTLYQIALPGATYNTSFKAYFEDSLQYPYNGVFFDNTNYYKIVNGYQDTILSEGCSETLSSYATPYSFYNAAEEEVVLYSTNSNYDPSNYTGLLGAKFFTSWQNAGNPIYSCYTDSSLVGYGTPVAYYGSLAQVAAGTPVTFYYGYVVDYLGIPV